MQQEWLVIRRKLNDIYCLLRICWTWSMPHTLKNLDAILFLILYLGHLRIDPQVFKGLSLSSEIWLSLGFCLTIWGWVMADGLILGLAHILPPLASAVAGQAVYGGMNHNQPVCWFGLCLMAITFGFIQNRNCPQILQSGFIVLILPLPVFCIATWLPLEGIHYIALGSCGGLRGTIPVTRVVCVFSSLKTVTQISFYDSLSQRQLIGCMREALLTRHT